MVAIGVSQREGNLKLLFDSLSSTLSTEALTNFYADIIQHSVPSAVSTFCVDATMYISGTSDLSPFNLNTALIPSIVFIGVYDISNTLST